jgi:hypothetical protein
LDGIEYEIKEYEHYHIEGKRGINNLIIENKDEEPLDILFLGM